MSEISIGYKSSSPLPDCPDAVKEDGKLFCANEDSRGSCSKDVCPRIHPIPKLENFPDLEKLLEKIQDIALMETEPTSLMFGWLIPTCLECNGVLSHSIGTSRVFCIKCNTIYRLEKVDD